MGFLSSVGSAISSGLNFLGNLVSGSSSGGGGSGGSSSSYTSSESSHTNYDPDKVRVAEIEARSQRDMAEHEIERMKLERELTEFNARMEAAVIEAKVRGHTMLQDKLVEMTKTLTQIAQERIVLLERGHLDVVAQIDKHYEQLRQEIKRDDDTYNFEKMPKLLSMLEQYPEGSTSHKMYSKLVEQDLVRHVDFQTQQFKSVLDRRSMMTTSAIACRERLEQHINGLVETRMQHLQLALDNSNPLSPAPLPAHQQPLLGSNHPSPLARLGNDGKTSTEA